MKNDGIDIPVLVWFARLLPLGESELILIFYWVHSAFFINHTLLFVEESRPKLTYFNFVKIKVRTYFVMRAGIYCAENMLRIQCENCSQHKAHVLLGSDCEKESINNKLLF